MACAWIGVWPKFVVPCLRFLTVSTAALVANLLLLSLFVLPGLHEVRAQATAVVLVMPLNFLGNKLWSFRL